MSNNFFTLSSLFYIVLLNIIYFSKPRVKTLDNKIFQIILVCSLTTVITAVLSSFTIRAMTNSIINIFISKLLLINFFTWQSLFAAYILSISFEKAEELLFSNKKTRIVFIILYFLIDLVICVLPLYYFNENNIVYSYGPSANLVFATAAVYSLFYTVCLFSNIKKMDKRYVPLFIYIVLGGIVIFVQKKNPELLLTTSMQAFVTFLMYFTIENPDMKMIEQLNFAKSQAEKANNAKTDFLSNMSHEIRTPLNAIVGFSHSLEKEDLPESAREDVKYIISASDNLLDLVNGILDISKIEANKLEIVNKEYNTHELLDGLVALSKARLGEEKPIEFRYKFDESLPEYLYGDSTRLKQVIINLLTNSIKYTDEGFIEFKVDYIKLKDNIVRLIISVEDSGIGIKKENIDMLFNKFQRLDLEKNISIEGTGLGLAITKKLVNLMGGRIVVQSVYGKGSKFTVAVDQRIVAAPEVETFKMPEGEMVSEFPGKRVLVVDDNKLNLKVAEKLLSEYKVVVECANSGDDAIEMVKNFEKYDIILMDDMMPHKTGSETLVELKQIPDFTVPVIALTANAIEGMKEKYLSIGFNDYLSKPIDKNELTRVLNTYLK